MKIVEYISFCRNERALQRLRRHHQKMIPEIMQILTIDEVGLSKTVESVISNDMGRAELLRQMREITPQARLFEILHPAAEAQKARLQLMQTQHAQTRWDKRLRTAFRHAKARQGLELDILKESIAIQRGRKTFS